MMLKMQAAGTVLFIESRANSKVVNKSRVTWCELNIPEHRAKAGNLQGRPGNRLLLSHTSFCIVPLRDRMFLDVLYLLQ